MGLGPFDSFSFPGVYTKTLNEAPTATASGELRVPAFIGVGDESVPVTNYEMIRGSSAMADNKIVKENVSGQFDGSNRNFTVSYFPIVVGDGNGTVTTDPTKVVVYVNGESVPVSSVKGETGQIFLVSIPAMGDEVLVSYYYKKTDEYHEAEDLTDQVDGLRKTFRTHYYPIVNGDNGGITTTDPTKITVRVNNVIVTVEALDGDSGLFTLVDTPLNGQTLTVSYYSNELQDTADILPSPYVDSITRVGYSPGTSDFVNGVDFVLDTTGAFHTIQWGHSYKLSSGTHTIGTEYFDDTQITPTLYDNRTFRRPMTGLVDATNATYTMEASPTDGVGRGFVTNNPTKVATYYGVSPTNATPDLAIQLNGSSKSVTLQSVPPIGNETYITEYRNMLPDDVWTLTCLTPGGVGVGEYSISGENSGVAMDVQWSASDTTVADFDFTSENVTYPNGTGEGNRDTQVIPGYAVVETVILTFADATTYTVGSSNPYGSGSGGDNTGYLNQTYLDIVTGFMVTVNEGNTVVYQAGDKIGYTVSPTIPVSSVPTRAIPGVRLAVVNTTGIGVGDTAVLTTYNKSGAEPNVGDFYYVTFNEFKQFDSSGLTKAKVYTLEKDVFASTGPLSITNKLGLAAHLAFLNGAAAVALLQIQKTVESDEAPSSRYIAGIDYFNEPMEAGVRPVLMEPVTTLTDVLSYLKTSNLIQSGIRYGNEHYSYFGFAVNTSPTTAQSFARAMNTERMIGIYPDGGVLALTDALGNDVEYLVDGSLLAAAVAGRDVSPAFDVAEPMTKKPITGIRRLYRRMDSVTAAQTANSGLTLLEELAAGIQIKFALTTDVSSVLTRTPSIIRTKDFIQRGARSILSVYIGSKLLDQRTSEIEQTLNSYLSALQQAQIITSYSNVSAKADANDPTIVNVEAFYRPIFPLLWIVLTFNLRSSV